MILAFCTNSHAWLRSYSCTFRRHMIDYMNERLAFGHQAELV